VACGTGPFLRVLPGTATGVGVDLAHAALRAGRGVCGDALALPLRAGVADAVTLLSSWWALPDVGAAVDEAVRVLRPGGTLLVHTWDRAPACRLITLGAVCVAKVLPSMIRPDGVRGPFDVPAGEVADVLGRAGLAVRGTARLEHVWPLGTVAGYWTEFGPLAPTSYAAYLDAPDRARAAVDRLLGGLLDRLRSEGAAGLGLSWRLTAAVKPRS
ncbi:class I SAM-dependent methyltransferase, partial [Actinosynnema sp. NPDC023658]|uniref:class I SAM-dependent methyltransferase n=1 Tax=Actinosynnema sp. NPDC023658 TaxID=3155465 RepID=UPI0033CA7A69